MEHSFHQLGTAAAKKLIARVVYHKHCIRFASFEATTSVEQLQLLAVAKLTAFFQSPPGLHLYRIRRTSLLLATGPGIHLRISPHGRG